MGAAIKLDEIDAGNMVNYLGVPWRVTEKSVCRESASYSEVQWTLESDSNGEAYLLKTEEKKTEGGTVVWVFTRGTGLGGVSYEKTTGEWRAFKELDMPSAPPKTVKFVSDYFSFDGETSGEAVDDEGDTVTKVTWDYYSADRRRNLAIEIWKEPDRDYPEAYDGKVVEPSAFTVQEAKFQVSGGARRSGWTPLPEELTKKMFVASMVGFVALTGGLPLDCLLFLGVPAGILAVMIALRPPPWLYLSSACVWAGVGALVRYKGFGLSFWYLTAFCAVLSLVLPRLIAAAFSGLTAARHYRVALYGVLPALWVYSFLEYFRYAPGPRAFYQVFAACLLPLAAAGLCALLGRLAEGSNG